jgi:hypothetical protein
VKSVVELFSTFSLQRVKSVFSSKSGIYQWRIRTAPCRTRTCDPRIRNPLLYPAELRAQLVATWEATMSQGRDEARRFTIGPRKRSGSRKSDRDEANKSTKTLKKALATVNSLNYDF